MSTTLTELKTFLAANGVSVPIQKGQIQPNPNECLVIYEYGGLAPDVVFGQAAIAVEYPRVQVVARGEPNDYETPRAVAETAYRAMAAAAHQKIPASTGTRYLAMEPLQSPYLIGKDENGRLLVGFNCQVTKELSV